MQRLCCKVRAIQGMGAVKKSIQRQAALNVIPGEFLQWLVSSRIRFLNDMKEGRPLKYFTAHLPVMVTWRPFIERHPFPVNMTVKGIGLLPEKELLEYYTDIYEGTLAEVRAMPWKESLHRRVAAIERLYSNIDNFDPTILGGLEIFEGRAFENLRENPYASLLYVGMAEKAGKMQYISFQVNGRVEILGKEDPHYRFLLASRRLFEFERFHIYQHNYPFGYLIRVVEVIDKSPWSRTMERPD